MNVSAAGDRAISNWLLACTAVIILIVAIGGGTRLTRSGLSIVEWAPVKGILPPVSEQSWQQEFEKYKQFPEYQKINRGMSLGEFKSIYWWEYLHRLAGRMAGVVLLLPLLYFLIRGRIRRGLLLSLGMIFLLGMFQGFLGWFMVKSGLQNNPHVSHFRLAMHLSLAFFIAGWLFKLALDQRDAYRSSRNPDSADRIHILIFSIILVLQILYGAFTAGLKAGFMHNTFPLMSGHLVAPGAWSMQPGIVNLLENGILVQFLHRLIGSLLLLSGTVLFIRLRGKDGEAAGFFLPVLLLLVLQYGLGVLILIMGVPVAGGVLHQSIALVLLLAVVRFLRAVRFRIGNG